MTRKSAVIGPSSRRRVLKHGLLLGGITVGASVPAAARGPRGGGGSGYITDKGWDKLDGGSAPFRFTGNEDLPNWRVPSNCRNHRNLKQANNVQVKNVNDGTPLGLLLPWNRHVPEPGSGPYEIATAHRGCGSSPDDSRNRELIRISFKPATPRR